MNKKQYALRLERRICELRIKLIKLEESDNISLRHIEELRETLRMIDYLEEKKELIEY